MSANRPPPPPPRPRSHHRPLPQPQITAVSPAIAECRVLKIVNLGHNDLRSVPDEYVTFRLNFHRFDRFELDLRGYTQP